MKILRTKLVISSLFILLLIAFTGCSSVKVTDKKEQKTENTKNEGGFSENFDFTPYSSIFPNLATISIDAEKIKKIAWYRYSGSIFENNDNPVKVKGYRIQILSSSNYYSIEQTKSEIYNLTGIDALYIDSDPPVYKLKMGNFLDQSSARQFKFHLQQIGFPKTLIVPDQVFVFEIK